MVVECKRVATDSDDPLRPEYVLISDCAQVEDADRIAASSFVPRIGSVWFIDDKLVVCTGTKIEHRSANLWRLVVYFEKITADCDG